MSQDEHADTLRFSRRIMLAAGVVGASAVALTACSKVRTPSAAAATTTVSSPPASSTTPNTATSADQSSAASEPAPANAIAKLSDITVGEAISATDASGAKIIIARPTATTVAAFSAVCTHQGCTVAPAGKQLNCPCHGSVFNATTGEVLQGPANRALDKVSVTISAGSIVAG
jgi:Rieske Fe-S protein